MQGEEKLEKELIRTIGQTVTEEVAESKGKRVFDNAVLKLKNFARPLVNSLTLKINK